MLHVPLINRNKMAKSFILPTMKVRRGCTKGKSTFKSISRGSMRLKRSLPYNFAVEKAKKMELHNEDYDVDDVNYDDDTDEWGSMDETIFRGVTSTHENLPNLYSVKQKVASDSWKAMREAIRNVCVEGAALPDGQLCVICLSDEATLWCVRCGASAYYCNDCWMSSHSKVNIFHIPQVWAVSQI